MDPISEKQESNPVEVAMIHSISEQDDSEWDNSFVEEDIDKKVVTKGGIHQQREYSNSSVLSIEQKIQNNGLVGDNDDDNDINRGQNKFQYRSDLSDIIGDIQEAKKTQDLVQNRRQKFRFSEMMLD